MIQLLLTIIIGLVVFLFALEHILRFSNHYKAFVRLNGPGPYIPLFGNALEVLFFSTESGFKKVREHAQNYRGGFAYLIVGKLYYFIYTAENFEKICNVSNTKKNFVYRFMRPFVKDGLLSSFGPKWLRRRKIITPTFHFNILKQFLNIMCNESQNLVGVLHCHASEGSATDITDVVPKLTLNIICETAMGIKIDVLGMATALQYRENFHKVARFLQLRTFSPHLYYDFMWWLSGKQKKFDELTRKVTGFTSKIIEERRSKFEAESVSMLHIDNDNVYLNKKPRFALLDTLFAAQRNGNQIDDDGIQEEVDTFVFTGHDTVSVAIINALMVIANHPKHQQRLYEEIIQAISNNNNEPLQVSQYPTLEFLDRVVKKILRLYPSAPVIARELMEELEINDVILPVGTSLNLMVYDLHRDPQHFPDPLRFDPDRFLPDLVEKRHPFAYLPFMAGPRNCIGQKFAVLQLKTVLINIISNFKLEPITRPEDMVFLTDLTLRTNHPVYVKFLSRSVETTKL